jgi:hypothetical protein
MISTTLCGVRHGFLKISTRYLGFLSSPCFLVLSAFTGWRIQQVSRHRNDGNRDGALDFTDKWQADVRQNSARSLAAAYSPGPAMFEFSGRHGATSVETTATQRNSELQKRSSSSAPAVGEVRKAWLAIREQANALKATGDEAATQALVRDKLVPATADYIRVTQALVDGQLTNVREPRAAIDALCSQLYLVGWPCASALPCSPVGASHAALPKALTWPATPRSGSVKVI